MEKGVVVINAEALYVFKSFEDWVMNAQRKIGGHYDAEKIICIDKDGNACNSGREFHYASDFDKFPVTAYRIIKSGEPTDFVARRKEGY